MKGFTTIHDGKCQFNWLYYYGCRKVQSTKLHLPNLNDKDLPAKMNRARVLTGHKQNTQHIVCRTLRKTLQNTQVERRKIDGMEM